MKFKKYLIESGLDLLKPIDPSEIEDRELEGIADKIKSTIRNTFLSDGTYHLHGNLDLSRNNLKSLLDIPIKISKIDGNFHCDNNQLTSLEGAPKEIGRDFYCGFNKLISLKGAPEKISGTFICSFNKLTSLKGAPKKVVKNFICINNNLINLEGSPKEVGGDFWCYFNQLTSLKGAPEKVGGYFACYENQLTRLEGAPKEVVGDFDCGNNPGPNGNGFAEADVKAVSNVKGQIRS